MYIVEGNIGAGKSTFLSLIEQYCPDITIIQEPKENWFIPNDGTSLFESFYKDPKRWAYTIETLIMACRVKNHMIAQVSTNPNRVMERSVYSGHLCFAQNGFNCGFFTKLEWEAYLKMVDFMIIEQCKTPIGFIYLQASPETCSNRIKIRNRTGEEIISIEYLQNIHYLHEQFLIEKKSTFDNIRHIPVLILDANLNFLQNKDHLMNMISKVKKFIEATQKTILVKSGVTKIGSVSV